MGGVQPSRSATPSPDSNHWHLALPSPPRPSTSRTQSHNPATERTSLLRSSPSRASFYTTDPTEQQPSPSSTGPGPNPEWSRSIRKLKRRSAAFSDLLSGRSHSSRKTSRVVGDDIGELEGREDDSDAEGGVSSTGEEEERVRSKRTSTKMRIGEGYDGDFRQELQGEGGNGVRQWYDNFHSIDWIHDSVKHSLRTRRLRNRIKTDGIRGVIANLWDGSQGWLLVTLVGFFTACIAFIIISSEMLLFDLKEGYCSTNPSLAKRFCCRSSTTTPIPFAPLSDFLSVRGAAPRASFLNGWKGQTSAMVESCEHWRTWGEVWSNTAAGGRGGVGDSWLVDYIAFIIIAVFFATVASTLTIYLSASTSVYSSKDSPSVPHPGLSPDYPALNFASSRSMSYASSISSSSTSIYQDRHTKIPVPHKRGRKVMFFAAGSGIPEIKCILSGFVIRGYLGSWTLATKSVGLALSVASGLSLGKEGPFVHIASCVGNIASRFFPKYDRNEAKRREIISAACAAGVAVSFGAPVGGTLFSLEEVSYYFPPRVMWRSFFCAMIAAMTLKLLDPFGSGKIVLFQVTYDRDWHTFELIGFAALGLFGGVYGALFCKANIWWTRNIRNGTLLKRHPIFEVALITLVTVMISFRSSFLSMGGTELVYELFSECHKKDSFDGLCVDNPDLVWGLVSSLGFALLIKALLTVVTFGIKLPAGIFIPTLAVGACTGRIAGLLVELLHARHPEMAIFDTCRGLDGPSPFGQACVLPGVWAMVGAAAALAGVTRTTVSLAVIMFELTGTLSYTVPVMLAVLIAKTVGDAVEPRSIYDLVIELSDLPYLDVKTEYIHESSPVDIMDADAPFIDLDADNTVDSLSRKLTKLYNEGSGSGFPILGQEKGGLRMFGYISSKELEHGLASATHSSPQTPCTFRTASALRAGVSLPASRVSTPAGIDLSWLVESTPLSINQRSPMQLAHEMFSKLGVRYLIVVDERGYYSGVVEKNRYLAYLKWLERVKEETRWEKVPRTDIDSA